RIQGTAGQLGTCYDAFALFNQQASTTQNRVGLLLVAVVWSNYNTQLLLVVFDRHATGNLGHRSHTLRGTGFEQFLDTRQTLGDIVSRRYTTGVEGTHGQLGTRLTDGLCGDNANSLADVHGLARCQRTAVAQCTGSDSRITGQYGANADFIHACSVQLVDQYVANIRTGGSQYGAFGVLHVGSQRTGVCRVLHGFVLDADACSVICNGNGQAALGTAVLFADDNVLRNVYQTTGQVTGVC